MKTGIYLLLGSNLGDPTGELERARMHIRSAVGRITQWSSLYRTAAWGEPDQPDFLNQVVKVSTALSPYQLLLEMHRIENLAGRVRTGTWEPRLLDIDLLFYHDQVISTQDLTVPHPRIADRRFTLVPLAEIAGELVHPVSGKTIADLLSECPDPLSVVRLL